MGFFSNEEFVRYKKCTQPVYQTPASVQQMLDISAIHENGIFEIERNNGSGNRKRKFDRVYSFSDLNYADQDRQRKDGICFQLRKFLNSMDTDFKITVQCEPRDVNNFRRSLLQDEEKSAYPELARYNNEMIQEWTLEDLRTLAAQSDIDSMKILQRKIEQLHKASQKKNNK